MKMIYKEFGLLLLGLLASFQAFCQDTLFFDKDWQPSERAAAEFFRLETTKGKSKSYTDYFLESGNIQNTGQYYRGKKVGEWVWWLDDGKKSMEEHWDNGVRNGAFREWYSDGSLEMERFYEGGRPVGKWAYYDEEGKLEEAYDAESGKPMPIVFQVLVKHPEPINMDRVRRLIGYPKLAQEAEIEGKVVVRVLVNKKGKVTKRKVLQEAHPLLNGAVMQQIGELRFTPGICDQGICEVWVTIPFDFKLLRGEEDHP